MSRWVTNPEREKLSWNKIQVEESRLQSRTPHYPTLETSKALFSTMHMFYSGTLFIGKGALNKL